MKRSINMSDKFCPYNISVIKQVVQRVYNDDGTEKENVLVESKVFLKCTDKCACMVDRKCTYKGVLG